MDALISAPAGVAILIEASGISSIHVDAPLRRISRRAEELHFVLGGASELQLLENVEFDDVVQHLELETDVAEALQLTLILLDPELSDEVRTAAADELNEVLERDDRCERLERVLYARPWPPDADRSGALGFAKGRASDAHKLLLELEVFQPAIQEVRRAWDEIPDEFFESAAGRRRLQAAAVREGLFKALALVRRNGAAFDSFVDGALLKGAIRAVEGHRQAIRSWVAPLRQVPEMRWERAAEVAEEVASLERERRGLRDQRKALEKGEPRKKRLQRERAGNEPLVAPVPLLELQGEDERAGNRLAEQWRKETGTEREESFRQIYLLFYRKVYRFFVRRGFPDEESKNLTEDTFLKVHQNLMSFRGDARFESWLYTLASSIYKNRFRMLSILKRDAQEVAWEDLAGGEWTEGEGPNSREMVERLYAAMADFPPVMRRCVMMRVARDMKHRKIAGVLRVSVDTVKAQLYQARQQLKGRLDDDLAELVL